MNEGLVKLIEKYYEEEYGKVLPKHITIEKFINDVFSKSRAEDQLTWIKRFIDIKPEMKILDFGAGLGDFVLFLRNHGFSVDGYEIDKRLYSISIQRDENSKENKFLYSEDGTIPAPPNTYDLVYSNFVLEHVKDLEKYIKEAVRVTRPDGHILITTCNYQMGYEYHYALLLPIFSRKLTKFVLHLFGRDTKFIDGINFITPSKISIVLNKLIKELNIEISNDSKRIFRKDLFNETVHSQKYRNIMRIIDILGLTRYLEKMDLYNPIVLNIRKIS